MTFQPIKNHATWIRLPKPNRTLENVAWHLREQHFNEPQQNIMRRRKKNERKTNYFVENYCVLHTKQTKKIIITTKTNVALRLGLCIFITKSVAALIISSQRFRDFVVQRTYTVCVFFSYLLVHLQAMHFSFASHVIQKCFCAQHTISTIFFSLSPSLSLVLLLQSAFRSEPIFAICILWRPNR